MAHPSISLALTLSLLAGVAAAATLMPPRGHALAKSTTAFLRPAAALREARESCDGYLTLHILLRSTSEADRFRNHGGCTRTLLDAGRHVSRPAEPSPR